MKRFCTFIFAAGLYSASSWSQNYTVAEWNRTRILVDSTYDVKPHQAAMDFVAPYKHRVDSIMSPVVGYLECAANIERPESKMMNLMADIMVWAGKKHGEKVDIGVYNFGGVRSPMARGPVTFGDVMAVSPFENKICFLSLRGDAVLELFQQMAVTGGECVSHGVQLVISQPKDGKLISARLNGKKINPKKLYRIATIDFIAQGNDNMAAFRKKQDVRSFSDPSFNAREIIAGYFREMKSKGIKVNPVVEGRITIKK